MKFWMGILIFIILVQTYFLVKMQRQIQDICRQLAFLMKHDSNMIITANMKKTTKQTNVHKDKVQKGMETNENLDLTAN